MPEIALGRDISVAVVPETTVGTLAIPATNGDNAILVSDGGTFTQAGNFIEDAQKRPTRSRFQRVRGKYNPGDWSFSTYIKPQTAAASATNNELLYEGLLGKRSYAAVTNGTLIVKGITGSFQDGETITGSVAGNCALAATDGAIGAILNCATVTAAFTAGETVTGGTSGATATVVEVTNTNVSFVPQSTVPSYSIWAKVGHTVLMNIGATINQATFTINGVDIGSVAWSGQFIKQLWTGTSPLTAIVNATDTTANVTDASLYNVDSRVVLVDSSGATVDDNAGAGYHVSAVNTTTNVITIDDAGGFANGVAATGSVAPWFPTVVDNGTIVHGRVGAVTFEGNSISVTDSSVSIDNGIQYIVDEKDGSDYPSIYVAPGQRTVEATVGLYFREADVQYFERGINAGQGDSLLPLGTTSGSRCKIFLPNSVFDIPALDSGDLIKLSTTLRGEASSPEVADEIAIVFD